MDAFGAQLLSKFKARQSAAREDAKRKAAQAKAAAEKEREERDVAKRQMAQEEAQRMLKKGTRSPLRRTLGKRRPASVDTALSPSKRARADIEASSRKKSVKRAPPQPKKPDYDPLKPLPGMEFVVRKAKSKDVSIPHTSDYSDMFGDEYLLGADIKLNADMVQASAEATAESQRLLNERKEKLKRIRQESEHRAELVNKGKLAPSKAKKKWNPSESDEWVAVDNPLVASREDPSLKKTQDLATAPKVVSRATKASEAAQLAAEMEKRRQALRERVLKLTGGGAASDSKPADVKRKPSPRKRQLLPPKRPPKRPERRSRDLSDSESEDDYRRADAKRRRVSTDRGSSRIRRPDVCSDAEEQSDDDSDGSFDNDFESLMAEEAESARIGRLDDKREREKELRRKKEKEERRRRFEESV